MLAVMTASHPETTFAEATSVKATSSHTYEADFPEDWCIGSVPHGGYITAVFLEVSGRHFQTTLSSQDQPHTIGLHLDFLRRTQSGAALFTVKDVKLGRQTSVVNITLTQGGREEVVGSLTQSNLLSESGVTFSTGYALLPPPPPVDLKRLTSDEDEHWLRKGDLPFANFRKATKKTEFHFPREETKRQSFSDAWIRLKNGEKWTNVSLGYVADMFAMPVEIHLEQAKPYEPHTPGKSEASPARFWYPTVLLNLDVKKALPEEGVEWLFSRTTAKQIKNGRMDVELVVLDEAGDMVALSHHIALAVGAERNLAKRNIGSSRM